MMNEFGIFSFVGPLINILTGIYILIKISGKKINLKDYKFYLYTLIFWILSIFNVIFVDYYFRIMVSTVLFSIYTKNVFNINMQKSIVIVIIEQLIMFGSEMMVSLFFVIFFENAMEFLLETNFGSLLGNLFISFLAIIISNFKFIKKQAQKIYEYIFNIEIRIRYFMFILLIITLNVLMAIIYFDSSSFKEQIINLGFIFIYSAILYYALNEKNENIKFKSKNKALMGNLSDYEKMLDYQRVANHENKNQLLVIKSMIEKKNKKVVEYINEVVKDKKEDNEVLLSMAKKIPEGGLQGIVYQKMLIMEEFNIKIDLKVGRNVRKLNFSDLDSKLSYDICRILGIFLDNAIEEVKTIDEKKLGVSFYLEEDKLIIDISNPFKEMPELDKIDLKGYTTKGDGHGYGLPLVKEIINKNPNLYNERSIVKNIFSQKLQIKM